MANTFWIKLYLEIIDDPKLGCLPDRLWRLFIECCLLAGKFGDAGQLPETSQIAWMLRRTTDETELDLKQLTLTGMVQRNQEGWFVTNFSKRQSPIPDDIRKRQQRDQEKKDQYYGHDDVTNLSRNVTQINRLTDNRLTDIDKDSSSSLGSSPSEKQEDEVLSQEWQEELTSIGVFRNCWPEIARSSWKDEEILALIEEVKKNKDQIDKPGGLFMWRLRNDEKPRIESVDRRKYTSGKYAEFVEH